MSFGLDKTLLASSFYWTFFKTKSSKTVLPEVHGEGVEGDDSGAGHCSQEGGEPGRAGDKGHIRVPAVRPVKCWDLYGGEAQ